jgi:cytochrome c oxidase subunit 2
VTGEPLSTFATRGLLLAQQQGSFWLPPRGSTTAGDVDRAFALVFWISLFFFVLIVALMVLFVVRYRRRPGHREQRTATHHLGLELIWSGIPIILVILMFYVGFKTFINMRIPPARAEEVNVTAQQWSWFFQYSNGHTDSELHVPVDEPVRLVMTSQDVIHSLYVPAFRLKMDLVPGRYSKAWFRATEPGEYPLYCAEYCGTRHSDMLSRVIVHPPGEYERWLADAGKWIDTVPPAVAGRYLVIGDEQGGRSQGCTQCHRVDGTDAIGPSLKGIFGKQVQLADGSTVTADENYIRESIVDPQAKVVAGFQPVMPTYKGRLNDPQISAIIAYLKELSGVATTQPTTSTGEAP